MSTKKIFLSTNLKPVSKSEFQSIRESRLERERREEKRRIQREKSDGKIHMGTMDGNFLKKLYGK